MVAGHAKLGARVMLKHGRLVVIGRHHAAKAVVAGGHLQLADGVRRNDDEHLRLRAEHPRQREGPCRAPGAVDGATAPRPEFFNDCAERGIVGEPVGQGGQNVGPLQGRPSLAAKLQREE